MSDTAASRSDSFVNQLLLEAGMDDDARLRPALLELRALADATPAPSAAVAALMMPAVAAAPQPAATLDDVPRADELAARRRAKRRVALTTLSVALSLSAGGAVAAASDQGIRESFTQLGHSITSFMTGSGGAPAGNQADEPAAPLPANPAGPATAPAVPAPGPDPVPAGGLPAVPSDGPGVPETAPGQASPGNAADLPASGTLPAAVPDDLAEGLGRPPVPVPGPSDITLPGTLPTVPVP
ncbi:hypothetical protein C3B78_18045 [Arthrobacter sp. PGP41]|uniref:hypothetical protein n=1 Tax=unclassified Arthrobacter TaxID=235627 RepID=UPI000CDCCFB5|nr:MULTISPECIES: hypothetical protein [unclassified Arthrobacter]AUZ36158.1 hypothetical protein C3B78_18045 [Arthrobacter sp. PGP41]MDT0194475.1 hypothetical protein [Arthrobacter sp. AB6]